MADKSRAQMIKELEAEDAKMAPATTREEMIAALEAQDNEPGPTAGDAFMEMIGDPILEKVGEVGQFIDAHTGAPARAGIGAMQEGEEPFSAIGEQFGEDPRYAPTGQQIVEKAGVPRTALSDVAPEGMFTETGEGLPLQKGGPLDFTASGVAGFGMDVGADPLAAAPVGKAGREILRAGKRTIEGVRGAERTQKMVAGLKNFPAETASKISSALTGIPAKEIRTYAQNLDEVNDLINKYGDDFIGMADEVKGKYNTTIQQFRRQQSQNIGTALANASPERNIPIDDISDSMREMMRKLDPDLDAEAIEEIDEILEKLEVVASRGGAEGTVNVQELFKIKEYLQETAKSAYMKGGQIMTRGKQAQRASKEGARVARKMLNRISPEIAEANNNLSLLHSIEERINKNILKEGGSPAALGAVGSGAMTQGTKQLRLLEQVTEQPFLIEAERIAAAKRFNDPQLLPVDFTGKSVARQAIPAMIGYSMGGPTGAVIAQAFTSPMTLKVAINAGQIPATFLSNVLGYPAKATAFTLKKAMDTLTGPQGDKILNESMRGARLYSIQEQEVELEPGDAALYKEDVMKDDSLSVIEKAKMRSKANKTGVATLKPDPAARPEPPPMIKRPPSINDVADRIRKARK